MRLCKFFGGVGQGLVQPSLLRRTCSEIQPISPTLLLLMNWSPIVHPLPRSFSVPTIRYALPEIMNLHQNLSQSPSDRRNKLEMSSVKKSNGYFFLEKKGSSHFFGNLKKKKKKRSSFLRCFPPLNLWRTVSSESWFWEALIFCATFVQTKQPANSR